LGKSLDRSVLAGYRAFDPIWPKIARRREVRDFRTVKLFTLDGSESVLDEVAQLVEYPEGKVDEGQYSFSVKKYGRRLPFSWETFINDDLGMLRDMPLRLGRAARRTEDKEVTKQFVDANGPHASFYTSGNKNIVNTANGAAANNPALTTAALGDALKVLSRQTDADGEPIQIEGAILVVPPALEVTALNILNALQLELTEAGGTTAQKLIAANWMRNRMTLVVDPYIPHIASTANGHTSWFVMANPDTGRPALVTGLLRGHTEPEVFVKESNARRVGGGTVPPEEGDFDTDALNYKVRHVIGSSRVDPKATVASNGSGS
jgi:hypothetical protein